MSKFLKIFVFFLFKMHTSLSGGDSHCSVFIPIAAEISEKFTGTIQEMQTSCIRSLSVYSVINANQPTKEFTNKLYEMYSDCAKKESDLFTETYDKLHSMIDPGNENGNNTVADFLSGTVDPLQYPFSCIASNVEEALDLVSVYDKELRDTLNLHLNHHQDPNDDQD